MVRVQVFSFTILMFGYLGDPDALYAQLEGR